MNSHDHTQHDGPKPCRWDRDTQQRVITAGPHRGEPCPEDHCLVCSREHTTTATPDTCPSCELTIAGDLDDIRGAYTDLAREALAAGRDGRLAAAAPIPGATAAVLIGPTVRLDMVRVSREMSKDHYASDPIPPLAILAEWEDRYRTWLGHDTATIGRRATVGGTIDYLRAQLPYIANHVSRTGPGMGPAPDFLTFTRRLRELRAQCERVLHDEREPEFGVECFECGDRLVRRFRTMRQCRHATSARRHLAAVATYPELAVYRTEIQAARMPCDACTERGQGGIDDPTVGRSWECPGCRKEYDPGEYATAIRRDLLDSDTEDGGGNAGWTDIAGAAQAATTLVGTLIADTTVRKWMDLGKVSAVCAWRPGARRGARLVFWPDVADRAVDAVSRIKANDQRQRLRVEQERQLRAAVDAGEEPAAAGKRLGLHPNLVRAILDRWDGAA